MRDRRQPRRDPQRSGLGGVALTSGLLVAALAISCGAEERPKPDRQQIKEVVLGFFTDIVDGDVAAACEKLSPIGRGWAVAETTVIGQAPPPATEEECLDSGMENDRKSVGLPIVVEEKLLRVKRVRLSDHRADVVVSAAGLTWRQRLRKTETGWKIDSYELPVRD